MKERRAEPDVHQDDGEARPAGLAKPGDAIQADMLEQPV